MENLNRAAAARLARVVCEDIVRWEPDAYAEAFARKTVETDLADDIEAGRAIFLSRAPVYGDLFDLAVRTCLVEGDFDGFANQTGRVSGARSIPGSGTPAPDSGFALAFEVSQLSTLMQLTTSPSEDSLEVVARVEESAGTSARVTAERSKEETWVLTLNGRMGSARPIARLSPEAGFLNQLKKRTLGEIEIGHPSVDDAYIIQARADAILMLSRLVEPLSRLTNPAAEIRFDQEDLSVYVVVEGTRNAAHAIDAMLDLWSRERSARFMADL